MITNCTDTVPYASDYLSNLTKVGLALIISTGIVTIFTLIISLRTSWLICKNTDNDQEKYICWLLVGICPMVGVTSYVGLLSPRSSQMNTLVSAMSVLCKYLANYTTPRSVLCKYLANYTTPWSVLYLTKVGLALIISTGIATIFTLIISLRTSWLICKNTDNDQEKYICWLLVGICPMVGVTSYVGLLSPRSSQMNTLVSAIYVSVTVVLFFRLIMLYMGGEGTLLTNLKGVKLPLSKPPFCFCICLRDVYLTRRTLQGIKMLVYQSVVVRPILLYANDVIKLEEKTSSSSLLQHPGKFFVTIMTMVSTVLSVMGLIATFRLSRNSLKHHGIVPKFIHMKLVLLFCDPQWAILKWIVTAGALPCSYIFYHPDKASTLYFILLCYEMLLLSILGLKHYGKKVPRTINTELQVSPKGDNSNDVSHHHPSSDTNQYRF